MSVIYADKICKEIVQFFLKSANTNSLLPVTNFLFFFANFSCFSPIIPSSSSLSKSESVHASNLRTGSSSSAQPLSHPLLYSSLNLIPHLFLSSKILRGDCMYRMYRSSIAAQIAGIKNSFLNVFGVNLGLHRMES